MQSEHRLAARMLESSEYLRELGIVENDLDAIGKLKLRNWQRADAPLRQAEEYAREHGFFDQDGKPHGFMALYVSLVNAERRALDALEAHLLERRRQKGEALRAHVADRYGDGESER